MLKVDSFLNHQMDIELFDQMGAEFKRRFAGEEITKILTIEASGIGIACVAAQHFHVPVVFAKKSKSINIEGEMYIEKGFQPGGRTIRNLGYHLESLAIVESMDAGNGTVVFAGGENYLQ